MQRCLAEALIHEARDPRLAGVNISRLRLTPDLKLARVYFLLLAEERVSRDEALAGLQKAVPFFRRRIAEVMQLRYTPDLRFFYDEELDEARRIDSVLRRSPGGEASSRRSEDDA